MRRLLAWLFPPPSKGDTRMENDVAGRVREAQQMLSSSARLVGIKAAANAAAARHETEVYRERARDKAAALLASESALQILAGGRDHHAPE